jgi:hypothetical protein
MSLIHNRVEIKIVGVNNLYDILNVSRNSSVGIATAYGLDDGEVGVRVPVGSIIFASPCCPDRLCGPPSILSKGYRGLFLRR